MRRRPRWLVTPFVILQAIDLPVSNSWSSTHSLIQTTRTGTCTSSRRCVAIRAVAVDAEKENAAREADNAGPLSLSLEELADILGGKGRAKSCWDCYQLGVDPLWFFENDDPNQREPIPHTLSKALSLSVEPETRSQIRERITPRRQSQGMGRNALQKLRQVVAVSPQPSAQKDNSATAKETETETEPMDSMASIATVTQLHRSLDGTAKIVLQLTDGLQVESVVIPWPDRETSSLCISNQVGCAQACTFCSTGRMGELRSLTADEILVQMYWAAKVCRIFPGLYPIDACIFMGMGEAARNVQHVVRAASHLVDPQLFQLAPRRVTISTVAPSPKAFEELGKAPVVLAWSVHSSEDALRKKLVPTTKHQMVELRDSLIKVLLGRPRKLRQIMLELALIENVNDRPQDAEHLAEFCNAFYEKVPGVKLVVNLIPWNDIAATSGPAKHYRKPSNGRILAFQKILVGKDMLCYVRTTRGDDESAACGQLATKASSKPNNKTD
ncbi:RNA methyltransferase RlmN [Seminavis robusta]|uniref:RNA methyltransferase RlmN n=1 Tax=Seminavis robusta TaxID=568900 RepID=A0A9N8DTY7_9STRA|nr:RNA methyltransferase RlmN [Seminavis robusta]|eukprot:Sro288_g108800.1 RNA methyltransferase RlmN (499) ;mRNA; r:38991-40487